MEETGKIMLIVGFHYQLISWITTIFNSIKVYFIN